uniref:Synaptobrevin, longin-like domain protein n=1 Tax=Tanacetum cinerariifolium TaxID=118510 RepID=A0A699HAH7_TANCI|nr:synaptobrevin, longin-like domain protein [Tanacetum cinerariifolium]
MVTILEKSEHNVDFYPIVDFIEASPLRYALTVKPTVYVSHIRQFWSIARIETTEEGTKILATVDGIIRTITESSLRRNLKLKDEEGISSLPDAELFENLTLMGYNISPNQKFTFQKVLFSHQWKYLIHTIMQCLSPKSTGFNEFSSNIATALVCLATNRTYNFSKMIFDGMVKKVHNKVSKFLMYPRQYTRRARIAQSSALLLVANEPASPLRDVIEEMVAKFEAQELEINRLKARVKLLEDREGVATERSRDDAPIKGRNLDEGEAAAERVSDDTEEMATVLTSMDATTVLASGVAEVPTGSGSIPTAGPPVAEVPTGSDVVPTAGLIFAIATVVTPYTRRKGKETMVESETLKKKKIQEQMDIQMARQLEEEMERDAQRMNEQIARDAEIARIHVEEELQSMIDGLDRSNETVAKYLQEYHQIASELPLDRRIELISDLVSNLGWKVKDFRGMSFEEIKAKFTTVWKQLEDFIPMGSKEEAKRLKRKGLSLEQESVKKLKTSEEVHEEVKSPDEVPKEKVKEMMQLVPIEEVYVESLQVKHPIIDWKVHTEGQRSFWKITRLGGSSASYQIFVDMLKHLDREDLNQLLSIVKESLSNRPPTSDKEIELWVELKRLYELDDEDQLWTHTQNLIHALVEWKLYDTCGVHHVTAKDKRYSYLWRRTTPLGKGRIVGNKMHKEFPLPVIEFPLPMKSPLALMSPLAVIVPTTSEVPTGSDVVPTAGLIFATATVVTLYTKRKGKETMVESKTLKKKKIQEQIDIQMTRQLEEEMERDAQRMNEQIAQDAEITRIHVEEELQSMIDGLDRSNETVAKYLQEYHQIASELPLERRIELISDLVSLEQESVKKLKTSEEVPEEVKSPDEVPEEKVKEMMQLVPIKKVYVESLQVKHPIIDWKVHTEGQRSFWKITRLGGSSASYQIFVDMLKHLDREDLNRLLSIVKESLSNRPPISDKEMELWVELKRLYEPDDEDQLWTHTQNLMHAPVKWKLYDTCGVHHVTAKDKEIFILGEKDYPFRKGLAIGMISYKLQVENYSNMANDLILKIYKIASSPR